MASPRRCAIRQRVLNRTQEPGEAARRERLRGRLLVRFTALRELEQVPIGEGCPVERAQADEAVRQAFPVLHATGSAAAGARRAAATAGAGGCAGLPARR